MKLTLNNVAFQICIDRLLSNFQKFNIYPNSLISSTLNTHKLMFNICGVALLCLSGNACALFSESTSLSISSIAKNNKPKVAIAIHGGAGTILKKNMTPETEAAYIEVLTQAIKKDYQQLLMGKDGTLVLVDANGNLVAGTSTGGMTAKRYGRVGDSPMIGAGTYANNESCAISATGHGEYFIRHNVASDICARVKYQGVSLNKAAHTVLFYVLNSEAGSSGVIAVDSKGNIAMPFNTAGMYRASIETEGKLTVSIYKV